MRADRHAVTDDGGPFNALGATFFWASWGYKFDRPRLERNLDELSRAGFDYIRVLGSVGGQSWQDRQIDPRWDDYDAIVAGLTDLAYDRYGLRVQWTILGGAPFTPAGAVRENLVDRFARLAKGREHKIFAFEIANEGWGSHLGLGTADGLAELRRLGRRLNDRTSVLVALTAPPENIAGSLCQTYAGAGADAATMHYERTVRKNDRHRPIWQPWTYPAAYDEGCRGALPALVLNNEPIGPESTVREDDNTRRMVAGFVMNFIASNAAYVFHSGPGIRGGGAADLALERHADFAGLPSFAPTAAAFQAAKRYLPAGLANWTRHDADAPTAAIEGFARVAKSGAITGAYSTTSGSRFVILVLGIREPVTIRSRTAVSFDVREPVTGEVLRHLDLRAGEAFTLDPNEALVLIGSNPVS